MTRLRVLVEAWLFLDFFGESRRTGKPGGTLTTTIVGQGFVALVFAALLYPDVPLVAFAGANLSLVTLLAGLSALSDPERSTRRRADLVLAGTAPLPAGTLALARGLHGAFALVLTSIGAALPAALLASFLPGSAWFVAPLQIAFAVCCAGVAHLGLVVLARVLGLLVSNLTVELVLATLKAALMAAGLLGFALGLSALQKTADATPFGTLLHAWPPWWCGRILAAPAASAGFWLALLGSLVGLGTLAVVVPDAPLRPRVARPLRNGLLDALQARLVRDPVRRGAARFVATMLLRSPGYRGKVLPLFGIPAAMIALAWRGIDAEGRTIWLGMSAMLPAMYVPFLVLFLPRTDRPTASWLFTSAPLDPVAVGRDAAAVALTTHVLVPAHGLVFVAMAVLGVPVLACVTIAAGSFALAVVATRLATQRLVAMPFTQPDEESGAGIDSGRVLALSMVLGGIGAGLGAISSAPWALVAMLVLAGIAVRGIVVRS